MTALKPSYRLIPNSTVRAFKELQDLPKWSTDSYLFAMPNQPGPQIWAKHHLQKELWESLTGEIGGRILELEFEIQKSDQAYVVDRTEYVKWQFEHTTNKIDAIKKYVKSRVPAEQYDGNYKLPELIIPKPISFDRLKTTKFFERQIVSYDDENHGIEFSDLDIATIKTKKDPEPWIIEMKKELEYML